MKRLVLALTAVLAALATGVYHSARGRRFLKPGSEYRWWL